MAPYLPSLASIAGFLALASSALAGFSATGTNNIAVYWGKRGESTYCDLRSTGELT